MTRVVISQPMYFPWAGFMAQMALADVYIWLDDAQFSKGSYTNRVQVKTQSGIKWMSIPLSGRGSFAEIRNLEAAGEAWWTPHRSLLAQALSGRPHTREALGLFDGVPKQGRLIDTLIASAEAMAKAMNILPPTILRTSAMNIEGSSWQRVLDLVKAVGGTTYITGHGALSYLDHEAFEREGVAVSYMDYNPLPWPQPFGPFTPYVTSLDLLASVMATEARDHLRPATLDWRAFKARKEASA